MFILIDRSFGSEASVVCTNTEGDTLIFDTLEEAQKEADECMDAIVVDLNLDCRIKDAAKRLIDELYKVYGKSIEWDEVKELEKYL